jgi:hypothetical protein
MLVVLGALLAVYFIAAPMWSDEGEETTAPLPTHTVAVIDHNLLNRLDIESEKGRLSFTLNASATEWNWSDDGDIPLDNMVFAELVTALNEAKTSYKLEDVSEAQLAEFGLDKPALRVSFGFSDGSVKEFLVGDLNNFNSLYYLCEASATDTVYMINSSVRNSLDLDIFDFVQIETPPTITAAKIIDANYFNAAQYRYFSYYPEGNEADYTDRYDWYFDDLSENMAGSPSLKPLRGELAAALTELITKLAFEECVALDCSDEKYGFSAERRLVIRYKSDEGDKGVLTEKEYVVYIGAQTEDGKLYARTDSSKLVYTLAESDEWITILTEETPKLMPDEIWLPNYDRVDSMTFTVGDKSLDIKLKSTDGKISYSSDASDDTDALAALVKALESMKAKSNVAFFEDDTAEVEKAEIFRVIIAFGEGNQPVSEIVVTRFSLNYCKVSFNGREDQLVTLEDAQKLADAVTAFFAG